MAKLLIFYNVFYLNLKIGVKMKKILAIGIMLCFVLLNVSVAQNDMARKTISFGVEKKVLPIGGPLKAEVKKLKWLFH